MFFKCYFGICILIRVVVFIKFSKTFFTDDVLIFITKNEIIFLSVFYLLHSVNMFLLSYSQLNGFMNIISYLASSYFF